MKKVGIVTWYWGNYGSILQAYALQNTIISMGYNCEIIQHRVNGNIKMQLKYRITHQGVLSTLIYYARKIVAKFSLRNYSKDLALRKACFDEFIINELTLSEEFYGNADYSKCQEYDCYVCGSDQIWNPKFTFFSPFYWLGFVKNRKKIAYAPSMGNASLSEREKRMIYRFLCDFAAISVREENASRLLKDIMKHDDIITVADPTMLISAKEWEKRLPCRSVEEKYLFAYLIRGNSKQREYINDIAKKYNLVLLTYPYLEGNLVKVDESNWGDIRCFKDKPFDFLEKIYNADMIITDSFHCSVFSLLFHKDFYVMEKVSDTTNQFGRLEQLLEMSNEMSRIIRIGDEVALLNDDFVESDRAIDKVRENSIKYLKEAINK